MPRDLLAYWSTPNEVNAAKVERVARRAAGTQGVSIRSIRMKQFDQEVQMIWNLYNAIVGTQLGFRSHDAGRILP